MSVPVTTAIGENSVQEIRILMKGKVIHAIPIISNPMNTPQAEITIRGIITAIDISKEVDSNATVEDIMTSSSVHIDSSA